MEGDERTRVEALLNCLTKGSVTHGLRFVIDDDKYEPTVAIWFDDDGGYTCHLVNVKAIRVDWEGKDKPGGWDEQESWNITFAVCDGIAVQGIRLRPMGTGSDVNAMNGMWGSVTFSWIQGYDDLSPELLEVL